MPHYVRQGDIPHKRHTVFRRPDGKLRFEELISTRGFDGPYALLYHEQFPVETTSISPGPAVNVEEWIVGTHRNHRFETARLDVSGDYFSSRRIVAYNDDVTVSVATPDKPMEGFFRNGACDELVVVVEGQGKILSPYGVLPFEVGDMIVLPRGTIQQFIPEGGAARLLIMESRTSIAPPGRYFVDGGQMAEHSPFCERDIKTPLLQPPIVERGSFKLLSKVGNSTTEYIHPHHPFDVVGWDGTLYPYSINMSDYEPLTRRIHTMPDEHQAFGTTGAAVLCFVPRMADYHPDAMPAPPVHANVDCDEILFTFGGPMLGRIGSGLADITFHPRGLRHSPKVYEETIGMTEFQGRAIAIDTFKPLRLTQWARSCDDEVYHKQWDAISKTGPGGEK